MPFSPYVRRIRGMIGHELLLLPGVTAVIRRGDSFLIARQRDTELWSLIGGGVEPGEEPVSAVAREVEEEIGVAPSVGRVIGAYGGPDLVSAYPNGDRVSYVTVAYECSLPTSRLRLERQELLEVAWGTIDEIAERRRHAWIDRVLGDALR